MCRRAAEKHSATRNQKDVKRKLLLRGCVKSGGGEKGLTPIPNEVTRMKGPQGVLRNRRKNIISSQPTREIKEGRRCYPLDTAEEVQLFYPFCS